tara:strand:+ start:2593 stop:3021 length:429 start_codon:yes stop_codon:yes gene_type:complete
MFKKFFNKKKSKESPEEKNILIASLLVHAAKMDESYTDIEKKIIKKALINLNGISLSQADDIVTKAEKKESEANQIVEFTREIKKYSMEYRLKIIEVIWKIVYSDGIIDSYETNLIRRVCGLVYVSDKDNGIIKNKVKNLLK